MAAASAIDPARLTVATAVVARLLPPGTYRKMMSGTLDQIMAMTQNSMFEMPLQSLAGAGLTETERARLGTGTIREVMALLDPSFETRQQITSKVIATEMINLMDSMEPELRDGMVEAYARRLSLTDLTALRVFLESPSGTAFSAEMMSIGTDPAIMGRMQAFVPKMTSALPVMMEKARVATADLPPPRKFGDLNATERTRLKAFLSGQK